MEEFKRRVFFIYTSFFVAFILAFLRLGELQVIKGLYYRRWSESNTLHTLPIRACRGNIYDAEGTLIATTRPSYNISLIKSAVNKMQLKSTVKKVCELLGLDEEKLLKRINDEDSDEVLIIRDAKKAQLLAIAERIDALPGIHIESVYTRFYPYREVLGCTLGYMSEEGWGAGIEKAFDIYLKGEDGRIIFETDALGRRLRILKRKEQKKGCELHLTLNMKLQEYIETLLKGRCGAVVVMDVRDGRILALATAESFDPNIFLGREEESIRRQILSSPNFPLLNRATCGMYPPGSAFKIVLFIAALEEGFSPNIHYTCKGEYPIGKRIFKCWKEEGHGRLSLLDAFAQSCNVYFYNLGIRLGGERILHFAKKLGFSQKTGIEFAPEKKGVLPLGIRFLGELANLSIGQGKILCTPIQMAVLASSLANGGKRLRPYIVKYIKKDGHILHSYEGKVEDSFSLKEETWSLLKEAMHRVTLKGTGIWAYTSGVSICGKTGTAQHPHGKDHAWFVCFFPKEAPLYAVVVFVEEGGSGGAVAAPIARKIIEYMMKMHIS